MAVKLTHRLTGASIEVADEKAAEFWLGCGYAAESTEAKKAPAKKSTAKRSSSAKK